MFGGEKKRSNKLILMKVSTNDSLADHTLAWPVVSNHKLNPASQVQERNPHHLDNPKLLRDLVSSHGVVPGVMTMLLLKLECAIIK